MKITVSVIKCKNYDEEEVIEAIRKSLNLLKIGKLIKERSTVLLKPNMFQGFSPDRCGTTHPIIVKAIILYLQTFRVKILIGDNPACLKSKSLQEYMKIAEITGIKKIADETGVTLIYPNKGIKISKWIISKVAFEVDMIVNIPKLKGHGLMGFTAAVKNMFGLIPGLRKLNYHSTLREKYKFAKMLVELCMLLNPQLTIIDAVKILDREGSVRREPKHLGLIISSLNPFAADLGVTKLLNIDPKEIPTVDISLKKMGNFLNFKNLQLIGENLSKMQLPNIEFTSYEYTNFKYQKVKHSLLPIIDRDKCTTCGACIMICPTSAIRIKYEKLIVEEGNCIGCYCCIEKCPSGALYLDRSYSYDKIYRKI